MLAQTIPEQPVFQVLQYGVLGIVLLAFIFGWIWARPAVQRLERDLDRVTAELRKLEESYREIVIPAITRSSEIIERMSRRWRDENER